jgi:glycosyltransferase involved in cell wall biosynthesis
MKIINIGSTNWNTRKGGASAVVREINKYFISQKEIKYINYEIADNLVSDKNNYFYSNSRTSILLKNIKLYLCLKKEIISSKNQEIIIISHYIPVLFISLFLIKFKKNIRHIHYFHGPGYLEYRAEGKSILHILTAYIIENLFYIFQKEVIFLSDSFKNLYSKHYINKHIQFKIIPYGVEFNRIEYFDKKKDNHFKIICVRRLQKRMGLDILIKSLKYLHSFNVEINIVGIGPEFNNLKNLSNLIGVQDKVIFHNSLSDKELKNLFLLMDLSILPTKSLEGFGISIIDSLIHGVPVIATSIGGIPEIINKLNPDYLISNASPYEIAQKIQKIIIGEIKLFEREKCIAFVENNFSYEKTYKQIL